MCRRVWKVHFLLLLLFTAGPVYAQRTAAYDNLLSDYRNALDLYEKEKYSAAMEAFDNFIASGKIDRHHEAYVNSRFHSAMCAVQLKRNDTESRLLSYENDFPHSPQVQIVYFELAKLYFEKKQYQTSLDWFAKVDKFHLSTEQIAEYYFKTGFAYNQLGKRPEAFLAFAEIKGTDNQYRYPALYYYSHMAYEDKNYQTALDGFLELTKANKFLSVVPYYVAQIYFLQKKYDDVISYVKPLLDTTGEKRVAELNQILGNSYYELKKYKEAVPHLEKYATMQPQTRDDYYRLGFSYYANKQYELAIARLGNTTKENDELSQKAWYHLGECYLQVNKKTEARSCYDQARKLKFNSEITEDAFYTYARLSYELSFNPYHDAITIMSDYLRAYPGSMHRDEVYGYLVNMYMAGKNYESAYESLTELGAKTPSMQRAYQFVAYNLGIDYLNKKQYEKAELMLRDVSKYLIDKELGALSQYWIAETFYLRNDYTASIEAYKTFMQQPGAFKLPLYNRSNYHIGYAHLQLAYAENENTTVQKPEMGNYNLSLDYFRRYVNDNSERDKERLQDAYLRIGDVYYIKSDNENAAKYYGLAVATPSSSSDYARFQKAMTDGLIGKNEEKITGLKELLRLFPNSRYAADAKFEIAQTYSIMDKQREALEYYAKVITDHPGNISRVKHARFGTALLQYQIKDYKKSEETYKVILDKYPNPVDQKEALKRMKDLYQAQNKVDDWVVLMKQYNLYDENKYAADTAYFENAESFYHAGDWASAIKTLDKYLEQFNPAHFALQAHFYLADSYVAKGEPNKSLEHFEYVIAQPANIYTSHSILSAARIYMQQKNTEKAKVMYLEVEKTASKADHVSEARLALMNIFDEGGDHEHAAEYATKMLAENPKDDERKAECHYIIGKGAYAKMNYDAARTSFDQVVKLTKSEKKGEAGYLLCEMRYISKAYKQTEKELYDYFKQKPTYSYWLAKGYILLALNYAAQGDTTQAKATLKSVMDNYKKLDDDILSSAQSTLDLLSPAPVNKLNVIPEGEIPIENGDGNGNGNNNGEAPEEKIEPKNE